jgi:thiol-disulfide isomerase/thioredoxin
MAQSFLQAMDRDAIACCRAAEDATFAAEGGLRESIVRVINALGPIGALLALLSLGGCSRAGSSRPSLDSTTTSAQSSEAITPTVPSDDPSATVGIVGQGTAGIGVALGKDEDHIIIKLVLPDSPAARNHAIRVGDRVVAVAENSDPAVELQGKTVEDAVRLIRGAEGSSVRLTLAGPTEDDAQARVVCVVRGEVGGLSTWGDGVLLPPGAEAPNIPMTAVPEMKPEYLADFRGKVVVVEIWATWCVPCQQGMRELQTYTVENPTWKDRVLLIAASVDEDHDELISRLNSNGWTRMHNVQIGAEAKKAYHVGAVPTVYIVDRDGKIAAAGHSLDIPTLVNALINQN